MSHKQSLSVRARLPRDRKWVESYLLVDNGDEIDVSIAEDKEGNIYYYVGENMIECCGAEQYQRCLKLKAFW
jgi:hypothetical protein